MKKKIVTIGGGSGQFTLLSGLRDIKNIDVSAVVSMVDSGGSTGRLRDEFGVLPPGDILKCVLALSPDRDTARKILLYRFKKDKRLNGHSAGNLLTTFLSQYTGSFPYGVSALAEMLGVKGNILPVTTDKATLVAELTDGSRVYGETAIDLPRGDQREKIKEAYLVPHHSDSIKVYPPVIEAISNADYIVIGPGDLYTSIIPNFLVPGVKESIKKTKAKVIYVMNIMTKFGETDNFNASDFIYKIEDSIERKLDYVLINSSKPSDKLLEKYKKQKAYFIDNGVESSEGVEIIKENLLDTTEEIIRHDSDKLARKILEIIS